MDIQTHVVCMQETLQGTALKVGLILSDRIDTRGKARKFKDAQTMMVWLNRQGKSVGIPQGVMYAETQALIAEGFFTIGYKGESLSLSRALPGVEA